MRVIAAAFGLLCIPDGLASLGYGGSSDHKASKQEKSSTSVVHGPSEGRLVYCIKSDQEWVSYLVEMAVSSVQEGTADRALKRLRALHAAVQKVQLGGDYVGCTEPVLLDHDTIINKLTILANRCKTDINVTRGVFVEDKEGFIRAMIMLLEEFQKRHPSRSAEKSLREANPK
jgi:hypothetical protein